MPAAAAPAMFRVESSKKATDAVRVQRERDKKGNKESQFFLFVARPLKNPKRKEKKRRLTGVDQRRGSTRIARAPLPSLLLLLRHGPRGRHQRQPERHVGRLADHWPPPPYQAERRRVSHYRFESDDLVEVALCIQAHKLQALGGVRVVGVGEDELCDTARNRVEQGLQGAVVRVVPGGEQVLVG